MSVRRLLPIPLMIVAITMLSLTPAGAVEPEVDLVDLLADPSAYSSPRVESIRVRGELVGDFGRRGDAVWTQLNDDAYAAAPLLSGGRLSGPNVGIGVRIPLAVWEDVGDAGGYRHRGAIVDLVGAWRYHDPDRGGESYLDVTGFAVVAPEQPLSEDVGWVPLGIGFALLGASGILTLRTRSRRAG